VYPSGGPIRPIDQLLADAYIAPAHDEYDQPSAAERIVRAARDLDVLTPDSEAPHARREQFAYELNLTSALIIGDTKAAAVLGLLFDKDGPEPEGAVVFGCLLHLTGRAKASRFWWHFAAGAGVHLGAYCLYLHHAQSAEFDEARYWQSEARDLLGRAPGPSRATPRGPLLPDPVYHALLVQCSRGQKPRLPIEIEVAVNQVLVDSDETGFGEIPWPSAQLPTVIAIAA
jgi:hypothetical protein